MIVNVPPVENAALQYENGVHCCQGDWTLDGIEQLNSQWRSGVPVSDALVFDGSAIRLIDTTGAQHLLQIMADLEQAGCTVQLIHQVVNSWQRVLVLDG